MNNDEITSSLRRALENVEKAAQAEKRRDEAKLDLLLWRAFSEIEYVSFLVSSETGDNEPVRGKRKRINKIDIESSLIDARDNLLDSLKLCEDDEISTRLGREVEKAKTSVFNAIRKHLAKNRKRKREVASRTPSSASSQ